MLAASLTTFAAVKETSRIVHTDNLHFHQMTRQLTTRTCARLDYASLAGQSMDRQCHKI